MIFGVVASFALMVVSCGSSDEDTLFEETYDSYFASFSSDYNPARSLNLNPPVW